MELSANPSLGSLGSSLGSLLVGSRAGTAGGANQPQRWKFVQTVRPSLRLVTVWEGMWPPCLAPAPIPGTALPTTGSGPTRTRPAPRLPGA